MKKANFTKADFDESINYIEKLIAEEWSPLVKKTVLRKTISIIKKCKYDSCNTNE